MSDSTPPFTALIDGLRSAVGAAHVLTHEEPRTDLSAWEQDWRKRESGRALAVVRPASTAEVAAVVKACAAAGVSIVPQGGNTGMVVGSIPDATGTQVLLSLQRMNAVRTVDAALQVTCRSGELLPFRALADASGYCRRTPIRRISKEGCRVYAKKGEVKKVKNGYGVAVVSTSKGVMSGEEAYQKGLGGEYICEAW